MIAYLFASEELKLFWQFKENLKLIAEFMKNHHVFIYCAKEVILKWKMPDQHKIIVDIQKKKLENEGSPYKNVK